MNAPFDTGDTLNQLGVMLCAVSNNHFFDFGKAIEDDVFDFKAHYLDCEAYLDDGLIIFLLYRRDLLVAGIIFI